MKKLLILLLTITTLNASFSFTEEDKQKHMAATAVTSLVSSNIAYYYGFDKYQSAWIGFGMGILIGLGKEVYDSRDGGTGFSSADMSADVFGSAVGAIPVLIIYKW